MVVIFMYCVVHSFGPTRNQSCTGSTIHSTVHMLYTASGFQPEIISHFEHSTVGIDSTEGWEWCRRLNEPVLHISTARNMSSRTFPRSMCAATGFAYYPALVSRVSSRVFLSICREFVSQRSHLHSEISYLKSGSKRFFYPLFFHISAS
jgi:hypothetical protein